MIIRNLDCTQALIHCHLQASDYMFAVSLHNWTQ